MQKNYRPRDNHNLGTLRHIYSTGSPLAPALFDYVYQHIHPQVLLGSITGKNVYFCASHRLNEPTKVGLTYVLCLPECVLLFLCIAEKSNAECSEWQLKASHPRERLTHLMRLVSLFA